jgi:hypothetical protein
MARYEKFMKRLMSGQADTDIAFSELCALLWRLGFVERTHGDHHVFTHDGMAEIINLQPLNAKAKPYQVKQVRNLIRKYHLDEEQA